MASTAAAQAAEPPLFAKDSLVVLKGTDPAVVVEAGPDKLEVLLLNKKTKKVRAKDAEAVHPGPVRSWELEELRQERPADPRRVEAAFEALAGSGDATTVHGLAALGFGRAFAPGNDRRTFWARPFERNVFTTDPGRFARIAGLLASAPHLFLGGPTIGWARAAFRAMRRFDDPRIAWRAGTPILIVASGADRVTDCAAAERFAARLAPGSLVVVDGAEHEILIERDALRDQFWAAFDAFVPGTPLFG